MKSFLEYIGFGFLVFFLFPISVIAQDTGGQNTSVKILIDVPSVRVQALLQGINSDGGVSSYCFESANVSFDSLVALSRYALYAKDRLTRLVILQSNALDSITFRLKFLLPDGRQITFWPDIENLPIDPIVGVVVKPPLLSITKDCLEVTYFASKVSSIEYSDDGGSNWLVLTNFADQSTGTNDFLYPIDYTEAPMRYYRALSR